MRVETHVTKEQRADAVLALGRATPTTASSSNTAIDELAALARQGPVALPPRPARRQAAAPRRARQGRHRGRLGQAAAPGHCHGIALQESFGSIVAQVVEVSVADGKTVRVHRVTCAVDCGFADQPGPGRRADARAAIVYGLTAALYGEITFDQGRVQQGNFDDYPMLRLDGCAAIDVHIVENGGPLGGLGEPGLPPLAPALAGAIFAATGKRIRRLPLSVSMA